MLYKISERDENAYSEQVQNSKSKNICAFYFDIFTILKLFSCFGAFDEKCRFKIQHWFHGSADQNLENLEKNLSNPRSTMTRTRKIHFDCQYYGLVTNDHGWTGLTWMHTIQYRGLNPGNVCCIFIFWVWLKMLKICRSDKLRLIYN